MAQGGDTITYTFSDGTSVAEDVSGIDTVVVDYCYGAGAGSYNGGSVTDATVDVSGFDTLYIWVASESETGESGVGRYDGYKGSIFNPAGAGSTEISRFNTDASDSADEPFLVGSGGAAGLDGQGARGGDAEGTPPPDGGAASSPGAGAIDDQNRGYILDGGTTKVGGGNSGDGEIQITYELPNTAPSITSGSESPTDGATGISLDPTLSIEVTDADGDSMDVTFYDASDDSQIGSTQTGVPDGGTASVTWSGRDWNTTYSCYAVADDGSATTTSSTFSFTTTDGVPPNIHVADDTVEDELTIDWDEVSEAAGYYVYRAESSFDDVANATQVADVTSPPYTDTGLEDGERFYYRVSSHD